MSRNLSESDVHALAAAAVARPEPTPLLPRKKFGRASQVVPQGEAHTCPRLPDCYHRSSWLELLQSVPATPAHEGVRFHSQLEHLKLFLAEQKPLSRGMAAPRILVGRSQSFPRSSTAAVTISRSGLSSRAESTCPRPYRWPKICVMSLSRTSSWLGLRLRVLFACAISHSKNGLRCASRSASGRQDRRAPRGTRSPFLLRFWLVPAGNGDDDGSCAAWAREGWLVCVPTSESGMLCLLQKALLVLHCKLALYYVQQSGAVSQRSIQTCLPRARIVTRVEGCGLCSYTWPLSGSRRRSPLTLIYTTA